MESIAGAAVVIITRDFGNFAHSGRAAYTDAIDTIQNNLADVTTLVEAVCKMCPDAIIINQVYPSEWNLICYALSFSKLASSKD